MQIIPATFEDREIRRLYDEKTETWFFSVVDIVQVLTQQPDFQTARKYRNKLKERLGKEGSQSVTNCHRLKLPAARNQSRQFRHLEKPQPLSGFPPPKSAKGVTTIRDRAIGDGRRIIFRLARQHFILYAYAYENYH